MQTFCYLFNLSPCFDETAIESSILIQFYDRYECYCWGIEPSFIFLKQGS